jgi:hypothetical protein
MLVARLTYVRFRKYFILYMQHKHRRNGLPKHSEIRPEFIDTHHKMPDLLILKLIVKHVNLAES